MIAFPLAFAQRTSKRNLLKDPATKAILQEFVLMTYRSLILEEVFEI